MPRTTTTTVTVRLSEPLSDFVAANAGEHTNRENVSETMRELIHHDLEKEQAPFNRLRAELAHAFAAPEASYRPLTAADVITRNRG
ncbi:addiction module antitoxin [Achromobacter spanius]|uniref:addiction module antitoxin n=1 Tax=Achromobacter spanius TaxID=217203 RepID=UPI003A8E4C51